MIKKKLSAIAVVFAATITGISAAHAAETRLAANGEVVELCDVDGIKKLVAQNGYEWELFSQQNTHPSLVIEYNGKRCYGDLVPGTGTGFNVQMRLFRSFPPRCFWQ